MSIRIALGLLTSSFATALASGAAAQMPICNDNASCAYPETCNTCPDECGSCDVADLTSQQAKFVDGSCAHAGDGWSDACATGAGQAGRFNDLQVALDSLVAGDTLYVHPGDYFRSGDAFRVQGIGTAASPIVITAADPTTPPVIHSWDPAAPGDNGASHPALTGAEEPVAHIVIDHLHIDGLLALHGDHMRAQNVVCTHGWGSCDGNWSCLRLEFCNDCVAHHNLVHDVFDTTGLCDGAGFDPRESGLKEFTCERTIWELNTITDTERWGYDLHRSSLDSVARFNLFQNAGSSVSIRMNRTGNQSAYGNVVIGGGSCIQLVGEDAGDGFANLVNHNTCLFSASGLYLNPHAPTTVAHNVLGHLASGTANLVNIALPPAEDGIPHQADRNAYDTSSWWVTEIYNAAYAHTLGEWQGSTSYDAHSIAGAGVACSFVDEPSGADDAEFDVTIDGGPCATVSESGGPIGACAIADCVGRRCEGCGDAPIDNPGGSGGGGGAAGSGGAAGGQGGTGGVAGGQAGSVPATSRDPDDDGGCGCRTAGGSRAAPASLAALLMATLAAALGRASRRRRGRGRASAAAPGPR